MVSNVSEGAECSFNFCRLCDGITTLQEVYRPNTRVVTLSVFWKNTTDCSIFKFLSGLNSLYVVRSLQCFNKLMFGLIEFHVGIFNL